MSPNISESDKQKILKLKKLQDNEKADLTKAEIFARVRSLLSDPDPKTPTIEEISNTHVKLLVMYFDSWIKTVTISDFLKYCAIIIKFIIDQETFKRQLYSPDDSKQLISFNINDLGNNDFISRLNELLVECNSLKQLGFLLSSNLLFHTDRKSPEILKSIKEYKGVEATYNLLQALNQIVLLYRSITTKKGRNNWIEMFKLGFFVGTTNSMISIHDFLFDDSSQKIMYSALSSDFVKKARWDIYNNEMEKTLVEPIKYAENKWRESNKKIYRNKMADMIINKYPKLNLSKERLMKILSPIAKNIRYSDFVNGEFGVQTRFKSKIKNLCLVIDGDKYGLGLKTPENTIEKLNEIIRRPNFYDKWGKRKGEISLSEEVENLISETKEYRKEKYDHLDDDNKRKIRRLNRLLLEHTYPLMTPKSLKHGLMRGWEGKSNKERY